MIPPVFIPERFKREILVHVFKNLWSNAIPSVPLILGIHGPSGWGKTFQCENILESIGAKVFLISGGQLESRDAGEPAELIRYTYLAAGETISKRESNLAVLLINDVDTGLGDWGDNVQKTINTQTVFGELMHLTDYPTIVHNRRTPRIPIILTGNDFTKLYFPLIRAGRMVSFEWLPTYSEKLSIIDRIFPELTYDECKSLVNALQPEVKHDTELSIAFFAYLRSALYDDIVWNLIKQQGVYHLLEKSRNGGLAPRIKAKVTLSLVMEKGIQLVTSSRFTNHLVGDI